MGRRWLLLICLVCASGAWAADSSEPSTAAGLFVKEASQGCLAEVELAKLAQLRSSNPTVKAYAATALRDYGKLRQQLEPLAKRKHLDFPTSLDDDSARIVHSVSAKPASEFDTEFSKQAADTHARLMTTFVDATALGDEDLAAFARTATPILKRQTQPLASLPTKLPEQPDKGKTISLAPGGVPVPPTPPPGQ
jgi:predicted outer membrane protein